MEHKPFLRENETTVFAFKTLHSPGEIQSIGWYDNLCERREHRVPWEYPKGRFRVDRRDP